MTLISKRKGVSNLNPPKKMINPPKKALSKVLKYLNI